MSYSDRKEGNWDYQRVSGQLKAQEKAQKEAIKAAEKAQKKAAKSSRRSYSAPKNLTVDQVMADYNSWNAKQPQTAEQVMADYNAWNTDSDAWMKSQTPVQPIQTQTSKKKETKKETMQEEQTPVKYGATRVHFDPTKQERPEPTAITKGKEIPQLEITDPSDAYNKVVDYKEALRKIDKEKEAQNERIAKNKSARVEKQKARSEQIIAKGDKRKQAAVPAYEKPFMRRTAEVVRDPSSVRKESKKSLGEIVSSANERAKHKRVAEQRMQDAYRESIQPQIDELNQEVPLAQAIANGDYTKTAEFNRLHNGKQEFNPVRGRDAHEAVKRQTKQDALSVLDEQYGRQKYGDEAYERMQAAKPAMQARYDELENILRNGNKAHVQEVNAAFDRLRSAYDANGYYDTARMEKDKQLVEDYQLGVNQPPSGLSLQEELEYNQLSLALLGDRERDAILQIAENTNAMGNTSGANGGAYQQEMMKKNQRLQAQVDELTNVLKQYGWDDEKINEYRLRAERVLRAEKAEGEGGPLFEINDDDNGLATFGKSVGNWFAGRLASIPSMLSVATNFEEKPEGQGLDLLGSPYAYFNRAENRNDQEVLDKAIGDNGVGRFLYGASTSMGDMGAQMVVAGGLMKLLGVAGAGEAMASAAKAGETITSAMKYAAGAEKVIQNLSLLSFGAKGYTSAYEQARANGASEEGAQLRALAGGLAEIVTEKISLDNLWGVYNDPNALKNVVKNVLRSGSIEGSEEIASDVVNDIADGLVSSMLRDTSTDFQHKVEAYMASGLSEEEAYSKAVQDRLVDYAYDGLAGALSGAGMGGAATIGSEINQMPQKRLQKQIETLENSAKEARFNKATAEGTNLATQSIPELQAHETPVIEQNNAPQEIGRDIGHQVAERYAASFDNVDPYESMDAFDGIETDVEKMADDINSGKDLTKYIEPLQQYAEDTDSPEERAELEGLIRDLTELNNNTAERAAQEQDLSPLDAVNDYTPQNIDQMHIDAYDTIPDLGQNATPQQIFDRQVSLNAQQMPTDTAMDAYTENITPDMDVPEYTNAFNAIYNAGVTGVDLNTAISGQVSDFVQNELGMDKARAIYDAGVQDYNDEAQRNASANTFKEFKIQRGTGSFKDTRTNKKNKVNTQFLKFLAKTTGLDIELADQTDPRFRAWINPEQSKITVTDGNIAQVMHELGEFTEFYNSADFENIRKAAMDASAKVLGADAYQRTLDAYTRAYRSVESDKTVLGASQEMTNDYLVALMNTEEGQKALAESLAQRYGSQAEGLVGKIKEFFDKIIRSMRSILKNTSLGSYQRQMLENKIAENEQNIKSFVEAFNKAIDNYNQAAEAAGVSVDEEGTNRYSIATYEDGGRAYLENYLNNLVEKKDLTKTDRDAIINTLDWAYNIATEYANDDEFSSFSNWSNTKLETDENNKPLLEILRSSDGRAVRSVIVNNGEYPLNVDFSQVCKKRLVLNAVLNRLVSDSNLNLATLTESDIAGINELIKKNEFEIACGLCFVDAKRYRVGGWAESFADGVIDKETKQKKLGWNDLVRSMLKDGTDASYFELSTNHDAPAGTPAHELSDDQLDFSTIDRIIKPYLKKNGKKVGRAIIDGKRVNPTEVVKMAHLLKTDPSSRRFLDKNDIIASEGLDALRSKYNKVYSLVRAHGGTSMPKLSHGFTAYGNDILKSDTWRGKKFNAEDAYSVGGVRVQSFSDYVANMFFDYMQMFADMAGKELPSHAYTKEAVYARLFGMTGQRINMSLIFKGANLTQEQSERLAKLSAKGGRDAILNDPEFGPMCEHAGLDENGNYIFEDESFDYDEALDIQNDPRYKNCGTIGVGLSSAHIWKMLADPNIKMVIPYHKSGVSHIIQQARNLGLYTDYTGVQNTRGTDGKKLEKGDFNWYAHLKSANNEKGHDAQTVAEEYLDWCKERKYTPKFDEFAYMPDGSVNPNYYKLLIDFRSYDNDGNFMPQGPVTMTFPEETEFKQLVTDSLRAQQGTEDRLEKHLSGEQGLLYDEVKSFLKKSGALSDNKGAKQSLDVDYINRQLDEQELFGEEQPAENISTETAETPQDIPEMKAPEQNTPEIPEMNEEPEEQKTGRTKRSEVIDNTLKRSGIFNEKEFNELVSNLANIQEQHEQETVDLAISNILNDHDGTMKKYMNAKGNDIKSFGDHDVDAMMMLIQEQKRVYENAVDPETKKQAANNIRKLSLTLRKTGTGLARGLQAFAKWTRNAEGAIATAEMLRQSAVQKVFNKNPKLQNDIAEVAGQIRMELNLQFFAKGKTPTESEARDVVNSILDTNKNVAKRMTDEAVKELTDDILKQKELDDLEDHIELLANGLFRIPEDVEKQVYDIFDKMQKYNFNSKDYVKLEKQAFGILANHIAPRGGTFDDKLDAWRYFSMLFNPLTHLRNIEGNVKFKGILGAKNTIATLIEMGADEVSKKRGKGGIGRTKALLGKGDAELIEACQQDALENAYRELAGNRYVGVAGGITREIPTFNTQTKRGRFLNKITEANSNALSKEDETFKFGKKFGAYKRAMAGYLKANGADASIFQAEDEASKELVNRARQYAIHEAKVATFQQDDRMGEWAKKWASADRRMRDSDNAAMRWTGRSLDILMPFKTTNANILETAFAYSPAEWIKVFTEIGKLKRGAIPPAEFIDHVAKSATGLMGIGVGAILRAIGLIHIGDDDREDAFNKQNGVPTYGIKLGDFVGNLSQSFPAAAPLINGAAIYDGFVKNGTPDPLNTILDGLSTMSDAVTDMSMLSGLTDLFTGLRYSKSGKEMLEQMLYKTGDNLLSQMFPQIGKSINNVIDPTARETSYTDKTGWAGKLDKSRQYLETKIPALPMAADWAADSGIPVLEDIGEALKVQPKIDAKGQVMKNNGGDNALLRFINSTINATNINKDTRSDLDLERIRLEKNPENAKTIPSIDSSTESKIGGEKLSPEDWKEYKQKRGEMREDISQAFYDSDEYEDFSDSERAQIFHEIDLFTKAAVRSEHGGSLTSKQEEYLDLYEDEGAEAVVDSITGDVQAKHLCDDIGVKTNSAIGKDIQSAYDDGDDELAQEYADMGEFITDSDLPSSAYGDAYKRLKWAHENNDDLDDEEWLEAYQYIDSLGDENGKIKRDELLDAMNQDKENAQQYEDWFWNYSTIPELGDDGDYKASRSKSSKKSEKESDDESGLSTTGTNGKSYAVKDQKGYQRGVKAYGSGYSEQQYVDTRNAIDTNGNNSITKAELKAYMAKHPDEADQLWATYAGSRWKR